jgi:23S rRNA (cytosine1962-C5)-methyltransferase
VLISCHTPELTPISLHHLLLQAFGENGTLHHGEMLLHGGADTLPVPSGSFCRWTCKTAR